MEMCVRLLPLLIFPLGFSMLPSDSVRKIIGRHFLFIWVFIASSFVILLFALIRIQVSNMSLDPMTFRSVISEGLGYASINSLYLSIFMGLGIVLVFSQYARKAYSNRKTLLVLPVMVMSFVILFLGYKASVLATGLVIITLAVAENKWPVWMLCASSFMIALFCYLFIDNLLLTKSLLNMGLESLTSLEGFEARKDIEYCTEAVLRDHWFLGHGIGDGKQALNDCLQSRNQSLSRLNYNSHNQFVGIVSKLGMIGLISLLISLGYNVNKVIQKGSTSAVSILMFFLLVMFTENILERQDGILPYALIISTFFISSALKRPKSFRFQLVDKLYRKN